MQEQRRAALEALSLGNKFYFTLHGISEQIEADQAGQFMRLNINNDKNTISEELRREEQSIKKKYRTIEEDNIEELEMAWDDVSGAALDPKKVRQARK